MKNEVSSYYLISLRLIKINYKYNFYGPAQVFTLTDPSLQKNRQRIRFVVLTKYRSYSL